MTRTTARILALICALGTLFLLFQIRFISPAEGEHVFIYSVPGDRRVGEAALQDLEAQLTERHGEARDTQDIGTMVWQDEQAQVLERIDHEFEVMGQSLDGSRYFSCTFRTTRNGVRNDKIKVAADQTLTYIAVDPAGEEGVQILWDTLEETTSSHWEDLQKLS